ncbi:MAG: VOC family protein [Gemmatimonadaceae bacterium]|nr:VOC family protein [Gemmatimonadaceae bacterium]
MQGLSTLGFHHITLVASDARRTLAFYHDVLGLRLVKQTVNFDDPGAYHLYFGNATGEPGTIVTFFEWSAAPRGRYGVGGVHHLAFSVPTYEALLKWKRRLNDLGMPASGPMPRGYFTSLYFRDPDGQVLEIATAGPGYTLDEPIEALGRAVMQQKDSQLPGGRDEVAIAATTHPEPVPSITPDMVLTGLHHITGMTDDIERASDFYEQALGLRLVKKTINQDDPDTPHWFWANYEGTRVLPGSAWTLFGWSPRHPKARGGIGQTHHVAFRAKDATEQLAWRDHLLSIGLNVSPVMDRQYFQSIYFSAPDGQLLEIATDGPGFAVDEPVSTLGEALKLPTWLEPHRAAIEGELGPLK